MANINYIGRHTTTYEVNEHYHNFWEIIYVTQGGGHIITSSNEKLPYLVNDIILIPPNIWHTNKSSTGFENIHLTVDNWTPNIKDVLLIKDNSELDLLVVMKQAHRYFHHADIPYRESIIISLTELIVSYIEMMIEQPSLSMITQIIENEIINNYTNPFFDVEKVYSKIPYSKEYSRKMFLKETGVSPLQFLIKKKIALATKMLATRKSKNTTISEIADKCGFADQLYFSRMFKKIMGVSPKYFKIEMLEDNKIFE